MDRKNTLLTYIFSSITVRSWMVSLKCVVSLKKRFDPSLLLSTSWIRYKKKCGDNELHELMEIFLVALGGCQEGND